MNLLVRGPKTLGLDQSFTEIIHSVNIWFCIFVEAVKFEITLRIHFEQEQ